MNNVDGETVLKVTIKSYRSLLFLMIFIAAACSSNADSADSVAAPAVDNNQAQAVDDSANDPANTTNTIPVNADGVQIVARVNGVEITRNDLDRAIARSSFEAEASDARTLEASVLDTLIEQELIVQAAAAQQITVDDATVNEEYQFYVENAGDTDSFQQWLAQNGYSDAEFREGLRMQLITHQMRDLVIGSIGDEVQQVHARHILVNTQDEANAIMERLRNGEDFAALAATLSNDVTTREQGGDLGWFAQEELLEPLLASTAFSLEPGQIAGPVATRLGFHIIQTLEVGLRPLTPERQANLAQLRFENWLQQQLQNATIERFI